MNTTHFVTIFDRKLKKCKKNSTLSNQKISFCFDQNVDLRNLDIMQSTNVLGCSQMRRFTLILHFSDVTSEKI